MKSFFYPFLFTLTFLPSWVFYYQFDIVLHPIVSNIYPQFFLFCLAIVVWAISNGKGWFTFSISHVLSVAIVMCLSIYNLLGAVNFGLMLPKDNCHNSLFVADGVFYPSPGRAFSSIIYTGDNMLDLTYERVASIYTGDAKDDPIYIEPYGSTDISDDIELLECIKDSFDYLEEQYEVDTIIRERKSYEWV